jgi:hypothetical protein
MANRFYLGALILIALGLVSVPMLNAEPPAGNVRYAIMHAKEAVDRGKLGHTEALVTHAEKSVKYAEIKGKNRHMAEGIKHLEQAIEFGKAGHAAKATTHAETGLAHLTEAK